MKTTYFLITSHFPCVPRSRKLMFLLQVYVYQSNSNWTFGAGSPHFAVPTPAPTCPLHPHTSTVHGPWYLPISAITHPLIPFLKPFLLLLLFFVFTLFCSFLLDCWDPLSHSSYSFPFSSFTQNSVSSFFFSFYLFRICLI